MVGDWVLHRREILENTAYQLQKPVEELVPWVDYDPISVDENAWRLARYSNWTED